MIKKIARVLMITVLMLLPFTSMAVDGGYQLSPGDVLSISVWGIQELQVKEVIIRPDGKIAVPLVGEVQAAGVSPAGLSEALTSSLSEYIRDPKVAVNVGKFHTTRVYVLGQVAKPGLYELEKQHNLLDAVGIAGGYTKDAAKKKIFIIRNGNTGESEPLKANLYDLLNKGDMSQNYTLNEGDVVYLTDNDRVDFRLDILPLIRAISGF
ncbi:MAG TPA: polysaccharide biosynthesis/export family protein [Methylomusa anaerophila]|uniref:Polysialic acid transport protein KpsD n=1 Tax=Methylomusa anaerophila TaxID=1930071 RepID=A0A348AGD5_9FIRM|nr:polysaccharide biosynthesis/export family protein [Methylomusa anaerophila]BBB90133.1 polysialic acid transport protein KpsD precursor [Methylomusa anaerophila]HML88143.1 polysaccharide biosynthesis/export family protein [Methylomusa anaerophila]